MAGLRRAGLLAAAALAAGLGWALRDLPAELGVRPLRSGPERAARLRRSPRFGDGTFHGSMPERTSVGAVTPGLLRELVSDRGVRRPTGPIPVLAPALPEPSAGGLSAVWYGHASTLVEIEGRHVLFDPIWSNRASPTQLAGPRRHHPLPAPLSALPKLDAIVISHDHYDHLDRATVMGLTRTQHAPFLVPLGIGAHLERWGVPLYRIVELDWEEETELSGLRFVATAARHFSGRWLRRNDTLWGSWVVAGERRRVFYAGDSGYFSGYRGIGSAYGPFDLTLMPIGAYSSAWPDIHLDPEQAVDAHLDLGGGLLLPVHWATFTLAPHPWAEPVERLLLEASRRAVDVVTPRPGEVVAVAAASPVDFWWRKLT